MDLSDDLGIGDMLSCYDYKPHSLDDFLIVVAQEDVKKNVNEFAQRGSLDIYFSIAKPLTNLLQKDSFQWNDDAQFACEQLKVALSTSPVLALPDFTKTFVIETDASSKGLGAVLMQDNHPLAFISKGLSMKQQVMSVYEKELLAVLMAVKHWHHYLIAKHFIIETDHKSLKYLLDQKISTPLQQT
ncbi:hypothetical protein E3N88_34891 [Mikania micrantha]|uniref:Reverse transcriptase/retrotransposon-derived protein RNase H-like domain-containing protein n=1 Tax=Mikania micrantha TaxID=192012 RepID=A0A5N6LZN4_9ASTR|nr:hypothetical protein E3N88_34891 [Mikania micrantha]